MTNIRELLTLNSGQLVTDGAGVKINRFIGNQQLNLLDPFLLFDAFESDKPSDYIGGFPSHPHRGFETVTYLLTGRMRHKDSAGNEGVIEPGGVQWMTAGKGIIHSEMPEQQDGLLQGFQLWVNLPAKEKMQKPAYQEFAVDEIAIEKSDIGIETRVIAGNTNQGTSGQVINNFVQPLYLDVSLSKGQEFAQTVAKDANVFLYVIEGELTVGNDKGKIGYKQLAVLTTGDSVQVTAVTNTRFLLIAAKPLNEPVARGGPFVMNTKAEVLQAFKDYENNTLLGD